MVNATDVRTRCLVVGPEPRAERMRAMQQWLRARNASGTNKVYKRFQRYYLQFAESRGILLNDDLSIAEFIKEFCVEERAYKAQTLGVATSAVSDLFRYDETNAASSPLVRDALQAAKRAAAPAAPKRALPGHVLKRLASSVQ